MKIHPSITSERIDTVIESNDCIGFCIACGETTFNVEPDAEKYKCESCGENKVYGAEEILIRFIDQLV